MIGIILKSKIGVAIVIYLIVMSFIVYTKPSFLYDHQKKRYKPFKTGSDGTIFPIWGIAIFMGIVSYCIALYISLVFKFDNCDTNPVTMSPQISLLQQQQSISPQMMMTNSPSSVSHMYPSQQPSPHFESSSYQSVPQQQIPLFVTGGGGYPMASNYCSVSSGCFSQQQPHNLNFPSSTYGGGGGGINKSAVHNTFNVPPSKVWREF